MLLMMLLTTTTAWAQATETVSYIDVDGKEKSVEATVIDNDYDLSFGLGGDGQTTWYVVTGDNVDYGSALFIDGDVRLILAQIGAITLSGGNVKASSYDGTVNLTCGYRNADRSETIASGNDIDLSGYDGVTIYPDVPVSYIDEDDVKRDVESENYTILEGGGATTLAAGTYVAYGNIDYGNTLNLSGNVNLILADGCTMNITATGGCIYADGYSLDIYGQTLGTGTLNAHGEAVSVIYIYNGSLGIHGGNVNATIEGTGIYEAAIVVARTTAGDALIIDRGTVTANGNNGYGINISGGVARINGGHVTATGASQGISVVRLNNGYNSVLTLGGGIVTASSFYTARDEQNGKYAGTIAIADGMTYTDGTNIYTDATESATFEALTNTTLYPCVEIAANGVEDGGVTNYWTTFYCGHTGYKIADAENACAYTAEYDATNSQLTLHKLGKVIPKQTAVILVGDDNSISMTGSTETAENTVSNDLHGVDVRTLKSTLGTGTFYVMSKVNSKFGFFEYTADYMPARKAYLLIDGGAAQANGLKMVFDDETTSLTPVPSPKGEGSDYWYTLSDTRLSAKPTNPGLYIHGNKKVVIK